MTEINNNNLESLENKSNCKKVGNKDEVYNGLAEKTCGGLKKDDLIQNKKGKIVSKKKYEQGLKAIENIKKNKAKHEEENESESEHENKIEEEKKALDESALNEIKATLPTVQEIKQNEQATEDNYAIKGNKAKGPRRPRAQ